MSAVVIIGVALVILALSILASQPDQPAGQALRTFLALPFQISDTDYARILDLDARLRASLTPEADQVAVEVVKNAIREYDLDKQGYFERVSALRQNIEEYPFVIDFETKQVVAHGALPERAGVKALVFDNDTDTIASEIEDRLRENGENGVWVEYLFLDARLDADMIKRSWLVLHDGYVFGAGHHYSIEIRVKHEVERAISLYDAEGRLAFDYINRLAETPYPNYISVVNIKTAEVVAHGAFSGEAVGTKVSASREGLTDLDQGDAFWLYVQNKNPMTELTDQKRVWLVRHDGYFFSSGYYYHAEDRVKYVVEKLIELYDGQGEGAIEHVNGMRSTEAHYPFILDPISGKVVAHGAFPERAGVDSVIFNDRTERSSADILADLENSGSAWTDYKFQNPRTDKSEHKRSYMRLHDGYVFGSGFYYSVFGG